MGQVAHIAFNEARYEDPAQRVAVWADDDGAVTHVEGGDQAGGLLQSIRDDVADGYPFQRICMSYRNCYVWVTPAPDWQDVEDGTADADWFEEDDDG